LSDKEFFDHVDLSKTVSNQKRTNLLLLPVAKPCLGLAMLPKGSEFIKAFNKED